VLVQLPLSDLERVPDDVDRIAAVTAAAGETAVTGTVRGGDEAFPWGSPSPQAMS
jgi:hypothetical protein